MENTTQNKIIVGIIVSVLGGLIVIFIEYYIIIPKQIKLKIITYQMNGDRNYNLGYYDKAIHYYEREIELDPNSEHAFIGLGDSYYMLQKYQEAIYNYKLASEINPVDTEIYKLIGGAYWHLKDWDATIDAYKKCLKLDPNNQYAAEWLKKAKQKKATEELLAVEQARQEGKDIWEVCKIINQTEFNIAYSVLNENDSWDHHTIKSGETWTFWRKNLNIIVKFDYSVSDGYQQRQYQLKSKGCGYFSSTATTYCEISA